MAIKPDPDPGGSGGSNAAAYPGPAHSWEGAVGDVRTGTGNKFTTISLIKWTARGGLPVELALYHNSQTPRSSTVGFGVKWNVSYQSYYYTDTSGNIILMWDNGSVEKFTKNPNGTFTAPAGLHDSIAANSGGYTVTDKEQTAYIFGGSFRSLNSIRDENGNTITINHNAYGLVSSVVDPTNRSVTLTYDGNSNLATVTSPTSQRWTFAYTSYYDSGQQATMYDLTQINSPALSGTAYNLQFTYSSGDNIKTMKDLRGNSSSFLYNSDSSLASETDAAGNLTSFSYGSTATTITDPNGHTTVHTYNASSQLVSVTDALNYTEYYAYDTANNVTQKEDRRGYYWNYTYDGMGNVLTAKDPNSNTTTYTYNAHNKMLTQTWPSGRSVANAYDSLDNLTQVRQKDAAGNVKATTIYTIGSYGLVSAKTDANNHKTLYTYDANCYLASTTTPLGNKTQWTYDALGFQTSRTDAMNRTTYYSPDAWERNVTTTYPDNSTSSYGYDTNSNLTAFANATTGSWSRTYDADNRMLVEYFGSTRDDTHTYDAAGQKGLLSTVTDFDGRVISYAYSARNELTSAGDSLGTATYQYDADGNKVQVNDPNGMFAQWGYDTAGQLTAALDATSGGSVIASYNYALNADSQITTLTEGTGPYNNFTQTSQTTYGYDALGHLTSEARTGQGAVSQIFSYDAVGNRTNLNNGGNNPFTYDSDDEPTAIGGSNTFGAGYNANGDRTSETINGQVTTFGYDYDDQLTSITKSGTTVLYRYDPLGRQVSKQVNSTFTGYYLDGNQVLIEKTGGTNTAQYLWGNGLVRCNGEYPLTDGRANVRLATNSSQQTTSANQPDAFGISSVTSGTASAYAYGGAAGYREDGISPAGLSSVYGFQKVGARYYDPTFGCFLTRDTDLSQSPYAYCDGDPVNHVDPSGHSKVSEWLKKLLQNLSSVSSTITKAVSGGVAAYGAGMGGSALLDAYNTQHINNQGLANEKTMLNNYLNSNPDADMTRQLDLYNYMRDGTFKADAGFAAQAGDQYLHGLGGAR